MHMNLLQHLNPAFGALDTLSVAMLLTSWIGIGLFIEHPPSRLPSVTLLMTRFRRDWMRVFVTRVPRIFDATVIDSLRTGTAFFASTCLIAIGGCLALIGNINTAESVAEGLMVGSPALLQIKLLLVIAFLADALLKYVWAHRLFGYCAILMAAVPNDPSDPTAFHRAAQAAEINITAARGFNRGLRSIYFSLAALGWLIGPVTLMVTTALTLAVLARREFASTSRRVLMTENLP
jgi:uncharacterized membrane protein